jgi:hypothetical protein
MLVSDVITAALYAINELAPGETPNSDDFTTGLATLNALLDSWNAIRLDVYVITVNNYPLSTSQGAYSIGPGGAFNNSRPVSIRAAAFQTATVPSFQFPVHIGSAEEFSKITDVNRQSNIVEMLWYDNEFPTGVIRIWPLPGTPAGSLNLWTWEQLVAFPLTSSTFNMPPAYALALQLNLAVQLAPIYGRSVGPELATNAMEAMAALRGVNAPPTPGAAQEGQAEGAQQPVPGIQNNAKP